MNPIFAVRVSYVALALVLFLTTLALGVTIGHLWQPDPNVAAAASIAGGTRPSTVRPERPNSVVTAPQANDGSDEMGIDSYRWFGERFTMRAGTHAMLIVTLIGALAACLHSLFSLAWYYGNGKYLPRWIGYYLVLPVQGAILALGAYLVLRAGFAGQPTQPTPYGPAAVAFLVGLFSRQAMEKLKAIFESVLAPAPSGANHAPSGAATLSATMKPSLLDLSTAQKATLEVGGLAPGTQPPTVALASGPAGAATVGPAQPLGTGSGFCFEVNVDPAKTPLGIPVPLSFLVQSGAQTQSVSLTVIR